MTATQIANELTAGDTWQWTRALADYPAPTWSAMVFFENAKKSFSASASVSGSDHAFSIPATTTADIPPGRYKWTVRVTSGATKLVVESGWIEVLRDPASAGNSDPRSENRKLLDAVNAALLRRATDDQLAMTLNGRSISRTPLPELERWQQRLEAQVLKEEQPERARSSRYIKVRLAR